MKEVIELTKKLRQKSKDIGGQVATALGIQEHEMPPGVFAMIFNKLTLALELLAYYYGEWTNTEIPDDPSLDRIVEENRQRVIAVQRMTLVEILSAIEFCLKNYVADNPHKIGTFTGRIYLRVIMERSKVKGVISSSGFKLWDGIIELRNAAVHNNAISERSEEYSFPKTKLVLESGKMIRGDLKLFPLLTEWLLDSTKSWILEMHKR